MRATTLSIACLATIAATIFSGCNIVGPALVLAEGPPKTQALYRLDSSRSHIILVDDMRSRLPKRSLRDAIVDAAEQTLLNEGALSEQQLISGRAVQRAMSDDRSGKPKPIAAIGRDAGAAAVIYVTMDGWLLTRDGRSAAPEAELRVKVIDCEKNKRLWPPADVGYALRVQPGALRGDMPIDPSERTRLEQELARLVGVSIAQVFFTHESADSARK